MIDAVMNGETYSDVYEVLCNFSREVAKLRSEKNLTTMLLRTMDEIVAM